MPAIRYIYSTGSPELITPTSYRRDNYVIVRYINGKEERMRCLGFICQHGIKHMPDGAWAKILAKDVTLDDGDIGSNWLQVFENQYVLGWRVQHDRAGSIGWSVFVMVNAAGLPVVMTDKTYKPPTQKKGGVYFLDNKKLKPGHKIADRKA